MSQSAIMRVEGLTKSFGGVQALKGVDLTFYAGEIHAVLGQNGAGKSTLVKLLTGIYPTNSARGKIFLNDKELVLQDPSNALKQGIGYVPQEIELVDNLTVAENIFAGKLPLRSGIFSKIYLKKEAARILRDFELDLPLDAFALSLGAAQRQMTMIARALVSNPSILLLDEPTTSLSTDDAQSLAKTLLSLKTKGVSMIYVTHRIPEVISLCDRATVLRDGGVSATLEKKDLNEERIVAAMIGTGLKDVPTLNSRIVEQSPILRVKDLSATASGPQSIAIQGITFDLFPGEILGLGGLVGSGRTELLSALYGRIPSSGSVELSGKEHLRRTPSLMRSSGMYLLTEDRKREGLLFNLNLVRNVTVGSLRLFSRLGIIQTKAETSRAIKQMKTLAIKTSSYTADPHQLSGGNQQKLLLARILIQNPKVLLLDEPTKGVDVGARHEIYGIMRELRESGTSIIVISSDLEELLIVAERVIVMSFGRKVDEFSRADGDESRILKGSAGLSVGVASGYASSIASKK